MSEKRKASSIVLGCMRIAGMETGALDQMIHTAIEENVRVIDHADIYGGGNSEKLFGTVLKVQPSLREELFIQSKCAIRPGVYDFSKDYILESVDGILDRLNTEYLDRLVLHRPDVLMEPEEVAEAFDILKANGKVRGFGVSNMNSMQIELLQRSLNQKIEVNQFQLSLAHTLIIDEGLNFNMPDTLGQMHTGSVLEYCRLNKIDIQTWSSLQYGFFEGTFLGSDKYPELNKKLDELAEKYGVTNGAIAIAWLLRIPGVNQAVVGTTKSSRIREMAKADQVAMTRKEWYELYLSVGNRLP